jgi:hypothetical protein
LRTQKIVQNTKFKLELVKYHFEIGLRNFFCKLPKTSSPHPKRPYPTQPHPKRRYPTQPSLITQTPIRKPQIPIHQTSIFYTHKFQTQPQKTFPKTQTLHFHIPNQTPRQDPLQNLIADIDDNILLNPHQIRHPVRDRKLPIPLNQQTKRSLHDPTAHEQKISNAYFKYDLPKASLMNYQTSTTAQFEKFFANHFFHTLKLQTNHLRYARWQAQQIKVQTKQNLIFSL